MSFPSYLSKLLSWVLVEIDTQEKDSNYFDFVTHCGLVSLSMGTIAYRTPSANDDSSPSKDSRASELP